MWTMLYRLNSWHTLKTNLQREFLTYFFEISESNLKLVKKPFAVPKEVRNDLQNKLIDLKNDSTVVAKSLRLSRKF